MNEHDLKHLIEATLLAAGRPVSSDQLLDLFDERERPTSEQLRAALDLLAAEYESRGIELIEVASGWRVQVRSRCADVVSRLWQERPSRYSRALLETLALIAYRQPITRSEIEEIRGVSISSTIMRTLQERNWIRVVGHREVPGHPELLGTTREFLDYFGLRSLDQLPTLHPKTPTTALHPRSSPLPTTATHPTDSPILSCRSGFRPTLTWPNACTSCSRSTASAHAAKSRSGFSRAAFSSTAAPPKPAPATPAVIASLSTVATSR